MTLGGELASPDPFADGREPAMFTAPAAAMPGASAVPPSTSYTLDGGAAAVEAAAAAAATSPTPYSPTYASAYNVANTGAGVPPHHHPHHQPYMYNNYAATPAGGAGYGYGYSSAYGAPPYASGYPGAYGAYGPGGGMAGATTTTPTRGQMSATAAGVQQSGADMLTTMQDAMTRFARVSAHVDEVLRHLHMLFDAVFGLGYSVGAVRAEAHLWLATKIGPVALVVRMARALTSLWRVVALFLMSPMAGRFSPVALVLRMLGLAPAEGEGERGEAGSAVEGQQQVSFADLWKGDADNLNDRGDGNSPERQGDSLEGERDMDHHYEYGRGGRGRGENGGVNGSADVSNM